MNITVELFGQLSPLSPRRQALNLEDSSRVRAAATVLGVNPDEIGLITINGVQSEMDDCLIENCRLCFFPYLSGG